jgi:prophage endopeptidase
MANKYFMALFIALAFGAGWGVNGWRLNAEISDIQGKHAGAQMVASRAALTLQQERDTARDTLGKLQSDIDKRGTVELTKVKNENDSLRADVTAGIKRLHLSAVCNAPSSDLPGTASGGRVDTGTTAGLTPDAEQNYFALRSGITATQTVLAACQATLRAASRTLDNQ